jgi:hypothetical protein
MTQAASPCRETIQMELCKSRLCVPAASSDIGCRVILDARLYREIETGHLIKHVLVANDALHDGWDKLEVSEGLKEKIEDTQSTIGINFKVLSSIHNTST